MKNFRFSKNTIKKLRDMPQTKRKYLQIMYLIKDLKQYIKNSPNSVVT